MIVSSEKQMARLDPGRKQRAKRSKVNQRMTLTSLLLQAPAGGATWEDLRFKAMDAFEVTENPGKRPNPPQAELAGEPTSSW